MTLPGAYTDHGSYDVRLTIEDQLTSAADNPSKDVLQRGNSRGTSWDTFTKELNAAATTVPASGPVSSEPCENFVDLTLDDAETESLSDWDIEDSASGPDEDETAAHVHMTSTPRPAWLKTGTKKRSIAKSKKTSPLTENARSLAALQRLERSPLHTWTSGQRKLLCILNRWYERSPHAFTAIFNNITGLELSQRKVTAQFEQHLQLYGRLAFAEYDEVFFKVPFNDPQNVFQDMRNVIEHAAADSNISLNRRQSELRSPQGNAARAKSLITRGRYNPLVRLNSARSSQSSTQPTPPSSGRSIRVQSEEEHIVDVGDSPHCPSTPLTPSTPSSNSHDSLPQTPFPMRQSRQFLAVPSVKAPRRPEAATPALAFRVWSESGSRAKFNPEKGFISEFFAMREAGVIPPRSLDDELIETHALNHLSKISRSRSAYISVSTSLIQVLNHEKARMEDGAEDVYLCLIDLSHANLGQKDKVLYARDVVRSLKSKGEMHWARHQALQEYITRSARPSDRDDIWQKQWGNIPRSSIMSIVALKDLGCAAGDFLSLDMFCPEEGQSPIRTAELAKILATKGLTFSCATCQTMGELAALVGLSQATARVKHIQDFIIVVVDGWSIKGAVSDPAARQFAIGE
ncbi:hypothetical protein M011DRAFT_455104 [Sporormia fimetaria CBS 119925]|uniref:DUF7587 domain-containing protein n=1 Tax=Sporormia fimetaria CBS 119925 TaxID=1340428 RepID=A0A6A6VSQ9_9PLEO|nr:hypothetical protein M011DRAFT_455104 [Sporormia fimetaria CBS 119925]